MVQGSDNEPLQWRFHEPGQECSPVSGIYMFNEHWPLQYVSLSFKQSILILITIGHSLDRDSTSQCTILPHLIRPDLVKGIDPLQASVFRNIIAVKIVSREELMTSYWAGNKVIKRMHLWTHEFSKTSQRISGTLFRTSAICLLDVSDTNVSVNLDLCFFSPSSAVQCSQMFSCFRSNHIHHTLCGAGSFMLV